MPASSQYDTAKRCYNYYMKNVRSILSHLAHQPQFKPLQKQKCYQKFITLLSPKYQKAIAFVYLREQTLYVALSHPGYKMELHYNRDLLKSVLTMMSEHDTECSGIQANNVVIFNSRYHAPSTQKALQTDPKYHELSYADFTIETKDKALREKFEAIKKRILGNRDDQ